MNSRSFTAISHCTPAHSCNLCPVSYSLLRATMDPIIVLQAGVASGTVLLFATIGEIFSERAGVLNLGVEGMMLFGAMSAYGVAVSTGNPWLAILVAMLAAGLLSQLHAFIVITLQSDQVVSGLALTFVGTGLSLVLGEGLSKAGAGAQLPVISTAAFENIPLLRPLYWLFNLPVLKQLSMIFIDQSVLVYLGYLLVPLTWYYIYRTR